MEKTWKNRLETIEFSSIFMTLSVMKNALTFLCTFHEKWSPKWSQNQYQNRTITILGGPRAARDPLWMFSARKKTEKGCSKIDAKKWCEIWRRNGIDPCFSEGPFWSRRGGKEGTSPSGTGDFGFDSVIQSKTPCTRRGAADFLMKNGPSSAQGSIYSQFLVAFEEFENTLIFRCFFGGPKIDPNRTLEPQGAPSPKKMKIRLSSHTRLQESKAPGQRPIIKEIQGKNNKH